MLKKMNGKSMVSVCSAIAIALGSSMLLQWLLQRGSSFTLFFVVFVVIGIGYALACCLYDPLKVYLAGSVFLMMINAKVIFDPVTDYIGGVGAGKFYAGVPHLVVGLGIVSFVIDKLRFPDRLSFRIGKSEFYVILFTVITLTAGLVAPFKAASVVQSNFYIVLLALYLLWSNAFRSLGRDRATKLFVRALSVGMLVQFGLCLLQLSLGKEIGLAFIGEGVLEERAGLNGSSITGTFNHPGPLSLFFLIGVSLLFPLVLQKRNFSAVVCFIAAIVGLVLTYSRTSLVIGAAVLLLEWLVLAYFSNKISKNRAALVAIVVIVVAFSMGDSIAARFSSLENNSNDDQIAHRLDHYRMAWDYIQQKPWLGNGLNNWSYVTQHTQLLTSVGSDIFYYTNPVHNIYLYVWFEGGLLMLAGFLLVIIHTLIGLLRKIKRRKELDIGLIASIVCVLAYGITGWGLFNGGQMLYIFYFILCVSNIKSDELAEDQ
ncbi:O-antigen ligase family protein [Cohnella faecalis]|uniref:O-antigen ligase family protein n=1 Tax=Cohnella faecalis TaxID=2315694 RepID=UPI001313D8B9|nr:O-antigen ligase family protein [Cohnella faecalis]